MHLPPAALAALADRLRAGDYTLDAVSDRIGEPGAAALARNTTPAVREAIGSQGDPQATLIRLWLLQDAVAGPALRDALGPALDDLLAAGLLVEPGGGLVEAPVVVRPYGAEAADTFDGWLFHDPLPSLDGRTTPTSLDHVLGPSPASTTLAQLTVRTPVGRALDLGTGCGVQSLHLARHAGDVVATDLNPRAVQLALLTAGVNGVAVDVREGSLFEPVAHESFDLITTNPPYVMSPPTGDRLTYREGRHAGDGLVREVVVSGARHLAPGGVLQVLANWAITDGEPWQDRLAGWIEPTGCDALVLQRERLDPYEYIEIWLADAGLVGTPAWSTRYSAWLEYFRSLRITGVGMGWITLYRTGRDAPDLEIVDWPHAVHQPVGPALAAHPDAVTAARLPDDELLRTAWRMVPGIRQETVGDPGAEHPSHVVLRQAAGLGRAVEVDTALGGVIGACDGDLPLAALVDAVAHLLGVPVDVLREDVVPRVRRLVRDGYLVAD